MNEAYHTSKQETPAGEERADLIERFRENVIGFERAAVKHFGAAGGIIARQLLFWDGKGGSPDFWIYKSHAEWHEDTGLKRRAQESGRKRLIEAGVMREEKRIGPDRRWRLFFRLYPWRLMEVVGDDLPNAEEIPAKSTVSDLTQTMADPTRTVAEVTQTVAQAPGYTEDYPEGNTEEVSPLDPPRGTAEGKKEKAGSVRGPSDTSSLGAGRSPKQNRAEGRDGKRSARKREPRGGVTSPDGIEAILSYKARRDTYDPIGLDVESHRKQLASIAERWDFASEEDPPMKLRCEISSDRVDCDRMLKRLRRMVRAADASPPGDRVQSADSPSLSGTPETDAPTAEGNVEAARDKGAEVDAILANALAEAETEGERQFIERQIRRLQGKAKPKEAVLDTDDLIEEF